MRSLRGRIFASFMVTFVVIASLFVLGMNYYVNQAYYYQKIEAMSQLTDKLGQQYRLTKSQDEALLLLDIFSSQFEGKITVYDKNNDMVVFENKKYLYRAGRLLREIRHAGKTAYIYETDYPVRQSEWLVYMDQLDDYRLVLLQIPVNTINETLAGLRVYFRRLLLVAFALVVIVSYSLSYTISKPISELNRLYKKLGQLEFAAEYQPKRRDEIGQLGVTLNQISQILEQTIGDLKKELKRKNRLDLFRRRFVAQVSHELQTPITVMSAHIEALQDGMVEHPEDYYYILAEECQRMSRIVSDLLDLSSLTSGVGEVEQKEIDLKQFVPDLVEHYQALATTASKRLIYQLMDRPMSGLSQTTDLMIMGDRWRLDQAIGNIISNALKHAEQKIDVELWPAKGQLLICNDGPFINQDDQPNIWDSFYKGSHEKTGTGLGLAIAAEIFKKHAIDYSTYNDQESGRVVFCLTFSMRSKKDFKD